MRHLDLFSGIGGFALAARWMNWETVQFVEIDKFCQQVLKKHWPNVPIHDDIKTFDGTKFRGTVDIVTGGFPCQPFSTAGKRKGKADDRYLWPEMLRVITEVRPTFIVAENVPGIIGLALDQVLTDLEEEGYWNYIDRQGRKKIAPLIIPACGVNAPHRRDRVWIVAYSNINTGFEIPGGLSEAKAREGLETQRDEIHQPAESGGGITPNTNGSERCEGRMHETESETSERYTGTSSTRHDRPDWQDFPTQPPLRVGNDVVPPGLVRSAIKGAGNAVVPVLVYELFKAIEQCKK